MTNPTKEYNDFVRANLPAGVTYNSDINRYVVNEKTWVAFTKSDWYLTYITKFGFSVGFDPATLFANDEVGVWYDPSDSSTVFQDTAATIPAQIGDLVGCILDKSGNNWHMIQATASSRPLLEQDINGKIYLDFDGVDDFLSAGNRVMPTPSGLETISAAENISVQIGTIFCMGGNTAEGFIERVPFSNTHYSPRFNGGRDTITIPLQTPPYKNIFYSNKNVNHTVKARVGSVNYVDGLADSRQLVIQMSGSTEVGAQKGFSSTFNFFHGKIYGILSRNIISDEDTLIALESYFANKAGVSI